MEHHEEHHGNGGSTFSLIRMIFPGALLILFMSVYSAYGRCDCTSTCCAKKECSEACEKEKHGEGHDEKHGEGHGEGHGEMHEEGHGEHH